MRRRTGITGREDGDFYCSKCKERLSVRKKNIISYLGDLPKTVVHVFVRWLKGEKHADIAREAGIGLQNVRRYAERLLGACIILLEQNSMRIGGPKIVVEVVECILHRRKYNRGRLKEADWMLRGVEHPQSIHDKPKMFLVSIRHRSRQTLEAAIRQWVVKGSIIITDCLKSYDNLDALGYYHYNVNHSEIFVNPDNLVHTERIEGLWHWIRVHAIPRSGCRYNEISFHIAA